jgi:dual specificity tyrosine-phosphorylation-regulated kinase 2/3/4
MEVMGTPPRHLLDAASRRKVFFDSAGAPRLQPNSRGRVRSPGGKTLRGALRCEDPAFVDLLEKCLKWVIGAV